MSFTTEQPECPICFDQIGNKNNITTECGHQFHASCLMKNITRNGFGCPCCRATMAEVSAEDEVEYTDDDETSTLLDDDHTEVIDEPFSDDALRGLRLLTNLLENNLHDPADEVAEDNYVGEVTDEEEHSQTHVPPPPREAIVRTLYEQGITYEQLVSWILLDHEEYENQNDELERFSTDLWGKIRIMISNYKPDQREEQEVTEESSTEPLLIPEALSPIHMIEEEQYVDFDENDDASSQDDDWNESSLKLFELDELTGFTWDYDSPSASSYYSSILPICGK